MTKVGIVDITFRKQPFRQKRGISEVVMVQTMPDGSLEESQAYLNQRVKKTFLAAKTLNGTSKYHAQITIISIGIIFNGEGKFDENETALEKILQAVIFLGILKKSQGEK